MGKRETLDGLYGFPNSGIAPAEQRLQEAWKASSPSYGIILYGTRVQYGTPPMI